MYTNGGKKHHHNSFITHSTAGGVKRTNRYLAALDFLLNIPMEKEQGIRQQGSRNINRVQNLELNIINGKGSNTDQGKRDQYNDQQLVNQDSNCPFTGSQNNTADKDYQGGLKLKGKQCPVAKLPQDLRYSLLKHFDLYQGANVRHWEDEMLGKRYNSSINNGTASSSSTLSQQSLLSSRCFVSRTGAYPICCFSIIKYDAGEEAKKINKLKADHRRGLEVFDLPQRDWRGLSYKPLFKPIEEDDSVNAYFYEKGYFYDPDYLDDPGMLFGSHRYVLPRAQITGPLVSSIILYVNKKELKESLNEKFREAHPHLPPSLTLSKIRSIKKAALLGCYSLDIEISTVAYAVIYFERLCMKGFVTKFNRHLTMAVTLLLACKFNENVTAKYHERLVRLLDFFDSEWEISRKEIFNAEFGAYVHLGFSLHIPHQHVHLVFTRLLKLIHKTNREYLRDEVDNSITAFTETN